MASNGGPVQFRGIDRVLEAFENMQIPAWSLWCGKAMNLYYDGDDMEQAKVKLDNYLRMCDQNSPATYMLCVYEELKPGERINSKTPYTASFNFKLQAYDAPSAAVAMISEEKRLMQETMRALTAEVSALRERLDAEAEPADEPQAGIGAVINGLLDMPEIKQAIAGRIIELFNKIVPMSNVNTAGRIAGPDPAPDQIDKLNQAIPVLLKHDPNLGDHLGMLAGLAERDHNKFMSLIGMLKSFV